MGGTLNSIMHLHLKLPDHPLHPTLHLHLHHCLVIPVLSEELDNSIQLLNFPSASPAPTRTRPTSSTSTLPIASHIRDCLPSPHFPPASIHCSPPPITRPSPQPQSSRTPFDDTPSLQPTTPSAVFLPNQIPAQYRQNQPAPALPSACVVPD